MIKNLSKTQRNSVGANKRTLVIASLRLLLYIVILSFSLSEIILITGDSSIYPGKGQIIAWHLSFSVLSLGMIIDASYVLVKNMQSAAIGKPKGMVRGFLEVFVSILSPIPFLGIVVIGAAVSLLGTVISLMTVVL